MFIQKSISILLSLFALQLLAKTSNGFSDSFWQITDVHLDQDYSRTGDPEDMCHGVGVVSDNGYYGNRVCDTDYQLMLTSFKAMSLLEPNPDFILWTGDNAPHIEYPNQTWTDVYTVNRVITRSIQSYFPTSIILPVLGNHDTVPSGQFPADDPAFYQAFLDVANWSSLIPPEQQISFLRGGYFSRQVRSGLKVVVLNTALYLQENENVSVADSDPSGQFSWLGHEFAMSRVMGEKVIVTSHVCAGFYANGATQLHMKPAFNDHLIASIANNSDVILSLVFGHEHVDTFRLFADQNGTFKTQAFLGGPVNPWIPEFMRNTSAVNPGLRLYRYNISAGLMSDYEQYYLDYREANANVTANRTCQAGAVTSSLTTSARATSNTPDSVCACIPDSENDVRKTNAGQWRSPGATGTSETCATLRLLYRPTIAYGVPDLSTASVVAMYEEIASSDSTFQLYRNYSCLDYVIAPCDAACRNNFLCSIANITAQQMTDCLNLTAVVTSTLSPDTVTEDSQLSGGDGVFGRLTDYLVNFGKFVYSSMLSGL